MAKHHKQLVWNAISRAKILSKFIADFSRAKRVPAEHHGQVNLPIPENLVITWPYTDRRPPTDRPSTPQAYQCKITQSTGVATQMKLEIILAGNGLATRVL